MLTIKSCKQGAEVWADGSNVEVITDMLLAIRTFHKFLASKDETLAEMFKSYMIEHVDMLFNYLEDDDDVEESEDDDETFTQEDIRKLIESVDALATILKGKQK